MERGAGSGGATMRPTWRWAWILLLTAGCLTPVVESGPLLGPQPTVDIENPVYIPLGPDSYGMVFEHVLSVLIDSGFEIQESNRFDGRIETLPRIAPGVGLFLKPGSPSFYERVLSTFQTYRHRVSVLIQPADAGGFFIEVIVRKELEDLARPTRATAGAALFRNENNIDRQFEVIDPTVVDSHWIYKSRDHFFEQKLIARLKACM